MKINYNCPYMKLAAMIENHLESKEECYHCCTDLQWHGITSYEVNENVYKPFFTVLFKPTNEEIQEYGVCDVAWMSAKGDPSPREDNLSRIVALTLASLIMQEEERIANTFAPEQI